MISVVWRLGTVEILVSLGVIFLLVGIFMSGSIVCTARLCPQPTGYEFQGVTLFHLYYYDGCNWCSMSTPFFLIPIGVVSISIGMIFKAINALQ
jgi:hypothetical protein